MIYAVIVFLIALFDQLLKFWTRANLPLGTSTPLIPYLFDLAYVQNTGAAFSMLSGHTWLLALVSAVASVGIGYILVKKLFPAKIAMISLSVVLGGAIGNLIDRAFLGYVTDMFKTTFMNFAIFNIADICVVCGGITFTVYYAFFYKDPAIAPCKNDPNFQPGLNAPFSPEESPTTTQEEVQSDEPSDSDFTADD